MADIIHANMTDSDGLHQPKGITTATANQIYVANGSSSGVWTDVDDFIQYSSICVFFEQGTPATRAISGGDIGAVLPLTLDYASECDNNFSYNDTTKEVTYNGTNTLIARFDASFSIAMPSGIGVTLSVWLQSDTGSGWNTLTKTLAQRKFSNNDVGVGGMTNLLTINNGDKFRPVFSVDAACTITVANIIYNFTGLRDLSI